MTQVEPFPVEQEYAAEIDGVPMGSYIEWMRSNSRISVTCCPAISVPVGFSAAGLPVGLQLVTRPFGERALLEVAHALELRTGLAAPHSAARGVVCARMGRFNISALDHVAIGVADVERSCAFYARVLGFERMIPEWDLPVVHGHARHRARDLRPGRSTRRRRPTTRAARPCASCTSRSASTATGLDAARRELADEDFKLTFTDHGVSHSLYFRDPDGHLIELTTYERLDRGRARRSRAAPPPTCRAPRCRACA